MKNFKSLFLLAISSMIWSNMFANQNNESVVSIPVYEEVVFYDGYRMKDNPDSLLNDGILRLSCSLYSKQLTEDILDKIGDKLDLNVYVHACCDNYDRIGNINIAFVPKGQQSYDPANTERIEIARFVTPFMDKNKEPNTVPYKYEMDYLTYLLRDSTIRSNNDLWLEFELFGVPYAGNKQIEGCEGRSDTFAGTLVFETNEPAPLLPNNVLVPIVIKKPEYIGANLNNYSQSGTDQIGKTVKTYTFDVLSDLTDSMITLITSNHGANRGGEEYNRRWHFVYFDDELVLSYLPGRPSCEPFRQFNTQRNGIYGRSEMTDTEWQSFSNWCPGDAIDNRILTTGNLKAGKHTIRIEVPEAKFVDNQGDIPVSMYLLGVENGSLPDDAHVSDNKLDKVNISKNNGLVSIATDLIVDNVKVFNTNGDVIHEQEGIESFEIPENSETVNLISVELDDGRIITKILP